MAVKDDRGRKEQIGEGLRRYFQPTTPPEPVVVGENCFKVYGCLKCPVLFCRLAGSRAIMFTPDGIVRVA